VSDADARSQLDELMRNVQQKRRVLRALVDRHFERPDVVSEPKHSPRRTGRLFDLVAETLESDLS
jgi:hypothetical protein